MARIPGTPLPEHIFGESALPWDPALFEAPRTPDLPEPQEDPGRETHEPLVGYEPNATLQLDAVASTGPTFVETFQQMVQSGPAKVGPGVPLEALMDMSANVGNGSTPEAGHGIPASETETSHGIPASRMEATHGIPDHRRRAAAAHGNPASGAIQTSPAFNPFVFEQLVRSGPMIDHTPAQRGESVARHQGPQSPQWANLTQEEGDLSFFDPPESDEMTLGGLGLPMVISTGLTKPSPNPLRADSSTGPTRPLQGSPPGTPRNTWFPGSFVSASREVTTRIIDKATVRHSAHTEQVTQFRTELDQFRSAETDRERRYREELEQLTPQIRTEFHNYYEYRWELLKTQAKAELAQSEQAMHGEVARNQKEVLTRLNMAEGQMNHGYEEALAKHKSQQRLAKSSYEALKKDHEGLRQEFRIAHSRSEQLAHLEIERNKLQSELTSSRKDAQVIQNERNESRLAEGNLERALQQENLLSRLLQKRETEAREAEASAVSEARQAREDVKHKERLLNNQVLATQATHDELRKYLKATNEETQVLKGQLGAETSEREAHLTTEIRSETDRVHALEKLVSEMRDSGPEGDRLKAELSQYRVYTQSVKEGALKLIANVHATEEAKEREGRELRQEPREVVAQRDENYNALAKTLSTENETGDGIPTPGRETGHRTSTPGLAQDSLGPAAVPPLSFSSACGSAPSQNLQNPPDCSCFPVDGPSASASAQPATTLRTETATKPAAERTTATGQTGTARTEATTNPQTPNTAAANPFMYGHTGIYNNDTQHPHPTSAQQQSRESAEAAMTTQRTTAAMVNPVTHSGACGYPQAQHGPCSASSPVFGTGLGNQAPTFGLGPQQGLSLDQDVRPQAQQELRILHQDVGPQTQREMRFYPTWSHPGSGQTLNEQQNPGHLVHTSLLRL